MKQQQKPNIMNRQATSAAAAAAVAATATAATATGTDNNSIIIALNPFDIQIALAWSVSSSAVDKSLLDELVTSWMTDGFHHQQQQLQQSSGTSPLGRLTLESILLNRIRQRKRQMKQSSRHYWNWRKLQSMQQIIWSFTYEGYTVWLQPSSETITSNVTQDDIVNIEGDVLSDPDQELLSVLQAADDSTGWGSAVTSAQAFLVASSSTSAVHDSFRSAAVASPSASVNTIVPTLVQTSVGQATSLGPVATILTLEPTASTPAPTASTTGIPSLLSTPAPSTSIPMDTGAPTAVQTTITPSATPVAIAATDAPTPTIVEPPQLSVEPTIAHTLTPALNPTLLPPPTVKPSVKEPTLLPPPTAIPSVTETTTAPSSPTLAPTVSPVTTLTPSSDLTPSPVAATSRPTATSQNPSASPSETIVTVEPTTRPTTRLPTKKPTIRPTALTIAPTSHPTTKKPTKRPTGKPTLLPTTLSPSIAPSPGPTITTPAPTITTPEPTVSTPEPTVSTPEPTVTTDMPTEVPSTSPTLPPTTLSPSKEPSRRPTHVPTKKPTETPSQLPSHEPSDMPSHRPSQKPTEKPTFQTQTPSFFPSEAPSHLMVAPLYKGINMTLYGLSTFPGTSASSWISATQEYITNYYKNQTSHVAIKGVILTVQSSTVVFSDRRHMALKRDLQQSGRPSVVVTYDQEFQYKALDDSVTTDYIVQQPFAGARSPYVNLLKDKNPIAFSTLTGTSAVTLPSKNPNSVISGNNTGGGGGGGGLSKTAIIAIGVGCGVLCLALLVALFGYLSEQRGRKYKRGIALKDSDEAPFSHVQLGSGADEISTLEEPQGPLNAGVGAGVAGYRDQSMQSVATVDYEYTKAYGGIGDKTVSSAGGTFGSNTQGNVEITAAAAAAGVSPLERSFSDSSDSFDARFRVPAPNVKEILIDVYAPPGKLGVVIDTPDDGAPVVHAIKDSSVIADELQVGDKLVAVDDEDVRAMSAIKVSKLISRGSENPSRKLTILRTVVEE